MYRVYSFDFDGCLFNDEYIKALKDNKADIIHCNVTLLNELKRQYQGKSLTFIGSNRQSYKLDLINGRIAKRGSCFPAIITVSNYLQSQLDPFLMADIFGNLEPGSSFKRAIENNPLHANCPFDESKVALLYAQMHKVAQSVNSGEKIEFHFLDDKEDILNPLLEFYSKHSELIPENTSLKLFQYKGFQLSPYGTIEGTGIVDGNYYRTVKDMFLSVRTLQGESMIYNLAKQLDVNNLLNRGFRGSFPGDYLLEINVRSALLKLFKQYLSLKKRGFLEISLRVKDLYLTLNELSHAFSQGMKKNLYTKACLNELNDAKLLLNQHRGWFRHVRARSIPFFKPHSAKCLEDLSDIMITLEK